MPLKNSEKCVTLYSTTKKGVITLKRNAIQDLIQWKSSEERKPLVMHGARQVGKTWLMKEFGQNYYDSYVYFNFDEEDELKSIFEANKNPHRIIELLSVKAAERVTLKRLSNGLFQPECSTVSTMFPRWSILFRHLTSSINSSSLYSTPDCSSTWLA